MNKKMLIEIKMIPKVKLSCLVSIFPNAKSGFFGSEGAFFPFSDFLRNVLVLGDSDAI
ncbi:MAG: hypothetical protein MUE75_17475 [Algoriphagus sp.]|nr:hypothetical protein [Algoriphagus sp.]